MAAFAPSYTGLSALLLPGQPLTNTEFGSGSDTWSVTESAEASALVQAVDTSDDWDALFSFEAPLANILSSRSDTWSASATEGATDAQVILARVDVWSTTGTEGAVGLDGNATAVPASDTWVIASDDVAVQSTFDYITEFSPRGAPGTQVDAITDKGLAPLAPVLTDDAWSYTWVESPIDTITIDTWDSLRTTAAVEIAAGLSTQDYPATDVWGLQLFDVSTVERLGPILQNLSDTWTVTFSAESIALADGVLDLSDDWSISLTEDPAQVDVVLDTITASDTWSASLALESGGASDVAPIPLISGDQWTVAALDTAGLVIFGAFDKTAADDWDIAAVDYGFLGEVVVQVQARRRIRVDGTIRHVDVE